MKITFETKELADARGILSLAISKNKDGALHLCSQNGQTKIVAYDDKNMQVSKYLTTTEISSKEAVIDKWLDKSFLDIVKAYANYGCNKLIMDFIMEYDDGEDRTIEITDENGRNSFKICEKQACRLLDENAVMKHSQAVSMITFEAKELTAAMDIYSYPAIDKFDGVLMTEETEDCTLRDGTVLFSTRALNGHRLAKGFVSATEVSGKKAEFCLSAELRAVIKELKGEINIGIFEKCLIIKAGTAFIICINKPAVMPVDTIDKILDSIKDTSYGFGVSLKNFMAAVDMATAVGVKKEKIIIFSYEKDELYLLQKDQSAKIKLDAEVFHPENFKPFALKSEYVLDVLKSIRLSNSEMAAVGVVLPNQPVYFTPSAKEGVNTGIHIILPVNIG